MNRPNLLNSSIMEPLGVFYGDDGCSVLKQKERQYRSSFGTVIVAEKEEFNFGGARFDALFLEKLKNLQSASVKNSTGALF